MKHKTKKRLSDNRTIKNTTMAISRKMLAQNIVLVTDSINVTSFSQYWFIKNGIFEEVDFQGSIFTPGLTLINTSDCQMTIVPNQIQLELKNDNQAMTMQCIENRMFKLIRCLLNVKVVAIGLNYIWKLQDDERTIPVLSKTLFGNVESGIQSFFCKEDARFGAYYSQNIDLSTRLKLDIKPSLAKENGQNIDFIMYNFNFHCDVPEQQMEEVLLNQLNKWQQFNNLANELVCL